ncbi:MAG: bifunctional 5,10-methylenetetrahydrofolate dehydrogenase/5,10-methenyltetrahydrofolate cyclohydrolase [Patescibacteria group bacterium]|nr:bifunctional 5,10-methylenetetrahydrofolate dehydrogenase/5,10-methenyltetrahydrofolate cyclohydrolase [Patescibacteria group bacterium]
MAKILDGKFLRDKIIENLKNKVNSLKIKPGLAVVLIGDNPASQVYVKNKILACHKIGFYSEQILLSVKASKDEIFSHLERLNKSTKIHGILVQYPLPDYLSYLEKEINEFINPQKDVDCFNPINVGKMFLSKSNDEKIFFPCTPKGIITLLKHYQIDISGKKAVIVGRSNLVGKPAAFMLCNEGATVTVAHSKTKNLFEVASQADILVVAVGKKNFIKKEAVKKDAVVIDVGINRDGKNIYGDIDYNDVFEKPSYITPVPGGVGPMTIASLMENVFLGYEIQMR